MNWLILSLLTAIAVSSHDAWVKRFFSHLSPYEMALYPLIYSALLFLILLPFVSVPRLDGTFAWTFIVSIPLNAVAIILYMKAIKISPLSLTVPYLAFTPVFMILTGYIFLDEMPNIWGILGIMSVFMGSYILNIDPRRWGLLSPLKAIFKETGSWLMLINAFLYSFAAVIGKMAVLHSSPVFFTISFFGCFGLLMFFTLWMFGKIHPKRFTETPLLGFIAGLLLFFHVLLHAWAVVLTKAAYMISVKRLSVVFGVIYGKLIFKEENIACRLSGAAMMLVGTVIITLYGM